MFQALSIGLESFCGQRNTSMESDKSSFKQKRQAGAAYVPKKNYGLQISRDGYAALKLNEVTSASQNQLCASDLASP